MAIKIGAVDIQQSTNFEIIPDDRQKTLETIGGVVVQDLGRVPEGDKFSCSIEIDNAGAEIIFDYWNNRTRVTLIDKAGNVYSNIRVVVQKYGYVESYEEEKIYTMNLEFWRK